MSKSPTKVQASESDSEAERRPAGSATLPVAEGRSRRRVLFVDDEEAVLAGLKAVLRPQRHEWDMVFALGGPEGVSELERQTFDVVVTDMRMPVVDGAALLAEAKLRQPWAVRLVLSGQTESRAALQAVFTAHQFLAKPCEPDFLRNVVQRCCGLHQLLQGEELRSLAGDVSLLPAPPSVYLAISRALAQPGSGIAEIASAIEREPAICAKVLQVANSAFFGLPRRVTSVSQAATYLGALALRDLALAIESMASLQPRTRGSGLSPAKYRAFQINALAVGLLAREWFGRDRRKADEAFVAGMLRDVGHVVLASRGEDGRGGAADHHAELSAYLLGLWGLPYPVLEAVAHHEEPHAVEHAELELVDVVHLCDCLVGERVASPFQPAPRLDRARFEALGVTAERLEQLKPRATALVAEATTLVGR